MKASEFKTEIKKLKNNLRGITLQLITPNSVRPYDTLREFGNAILNEESKGNSFTINQIWTNDGVVIVTSLKQLAKLFGKKTITGIQFRTYYEPIGHSESSSYNLGSLD